MRQPGSAAHVTHGKEHDQLTSLSYYGYRFYDRLTLTWTQADPLYRFVPDLAWDEPRRANLYSFSLNNALRYIDPDGRDRDTDADAKVNREIEKKRREDEEERKRKEREKYEKECVNTPIAAGNCPSVQARATFTGDIGPDVHEDVKQEARDELAADLSNRYATVAAVALVSPAQVDFRATAAGSVRCRGQCALGKSFPEPPIW
jgi:RHS repeat-associated protein